MNVLRAERPPVAADSAGARLLRGAVACARAALVEASDTTWDGSEPPQGIYFHWYEPSFYTGFAPRTQDPHARAHPSCRAATRCASPWCSATHELDAYLDDLVLRRKTYQELIDAKVIELTTNNGVRALRRRSSTRRAWPMRPRAAHASGPTPIGRRAVDIMSALNPERVFRIKMPVDAVAGAAGTPAERRRPGGSDARSSTPPTRSPRPREPVRS